MALQPNEMTFGGGVRCTSVGAGCFSTAVTTVGSDSRFYGPDFSMGFRFQIVAQGFPRRAVVSLPRFNLFVDRALGSAFFDLWGVLTPDSGNVTQHSILGAIAEDGDEHSVAWTFDGDGNSIIYYDGAVQETLAALGADLTTAETPPADVFRIKGTITDSTGFDVDNVWYVNQVFSAAQITSIHTAGLS